MKIHKSPDRLIDKICFAKQHMFNKGGLDRVAGHEAAYAVNVVYAAGIADLTKVGPAL